MRSDGTIRFYGPYKHGSRWRLRRVSSGESAWIPYDTEESALRAKRAAERKVETTGRKITEAMADYLKYLKEDQQRAPNTLAAVENFLAALFPDPAETLADIDADHYTALRRRPGRTKGSTTAAATHQRALRAGQAFCAWCVGKGWLKSNPLAEVKPVGRARKGKDQLTMDEAGRWLATALRVAPSTPGALGALCCFALAFRVSEVLSRQVRDLDNGGMVLLVRGKGSTDNVGVELFDEDGPCPPLDALRGLLQASAKGKLPLAPLIDTTEFAITYWTRQICDQAGVPRVCPHSLRGLHSTAALRGGQTPAAVCRTLRHSEAIDRQHYAKAGAQAEGERKRLLRLVGEG